MKRHSVLIALLLSLQLLPGLAAAHPPEEEEKPPAPGPAATPPQPAPTPQLASETASAGQEEKGKEEKKDKWDVNNPPGPSSEVTIDVDEGTWMSLDVSPDGQEIVFDLLGDLYAIPIGGGEARALTHDVAWQMQPRYSPDGKHIAFTSDQGGGDNVWVMDRDGGKPRQVTQESFRLLNSPAWTPDGEFLVARKHFTATRSLGAGEMWLYHRSGGEGLQLTKKPNDQKDAGEPVFSPDGRYLYFSQDTTPGPVFEYNKDPNGQIYVIQRLDRETGEIEAYVTGAGGAIRPTPSPDGKLLAFVRRVRGKSVIHLRDLRSGEEWPVHDGLDRDMQETWAIHGVYPAMAWTPDSRSLVFWAGGKIRRLDLSGGGSGGSGAVRDIPFRVRTTRRVNQALRFPVEVAPERFPARMLRWVEVSPKGDRVVYSALGQIWIRDLPEGKPRRLTRQSDHLEYYPSFSRDGRSIVYVTWDDEELGSLRVAPADGGEGRVITSEPGHYVEPAFTPDGKQVVFRRVRGGGLRTSAWSGEPGIYRIPAGGGASTLITREGSRPHFGATGDRVYLTKIGEKRELISIGLDRTEPRTHLSSENAVDFRVSPDGRWVAFQERFNAFIAPLAATGKAVDIGPKTKSIPVARVSRDAGEYLRWSGDSRRLYWSLGPELFSRSLNEAFAFLDGAPEKLPGPPEKGIDIGFQVTSDVPTGSVALVGARLITMRGDEIIEDGTVVIEGNRIRAVGPRAQVTVPKGAHVIDARGKTILPGLVDVHWHGSFGGDGILPEQSWENAASLAFGVTTLHDPSNDNATVFTAAEMARAGRILAPRVFSTGTILYGASLPNATATIDSLDDARSHLRRMKAIGAISVKSYNQPRREQRQQVVTAARELGMMVVPEGGSLYQHNMTMVVDGHTGIEHSLPVARIYDDVIQLWKATEVGYTPTLVVAYGGPFGETYWYQHTRVWEDERLLSFVPREVIDQVARRPLVMAPEEEFNHIQVARAAKELNDAGVEVQMGAHGQREGLGAHWEIWMLAQGGMTPHHALRAATIDGARYLGLDGDIGSIEPGKLADLAVLDADPLADIRNSRSVGLVVLNGRVYDARTLDQIGNHTKKREPFFWQRQKPAFATAARQP